MWHEEDSEYCVFILSLVSPGFAPWAGATSKSEVLQH
jgi:hypothetical protein